MSWDLHDIIPSFRARLVAEKQIHVYFIPGQDKQGRKTYLYAVASSVLHDMFVESIKLGAIPDFAVVVETGFGEPSAEVKAKIKLYYGFDHSH